MAGVVVLQFIGRQSWQVGQHATQIQLHIDLVTLSAGDQRPQHGLALGRFVVPRK